MKFLNRVKKIFQNNDQEIHENGKKDDFSDLYGRTEYDQIIELTSEFLSYDPLVNDHTEIMRHQYWHLKSLMGKFEFDLALLKGEKFLQDWGLSVPPSPIYAFLIFEVADISLQKMQIEPELTPYAQSLLAFTINCIEHIRKAPYYDEMEHELIHDLNSMYEFSTKMLKMLESSPNAGTLHTLSRKEDSHLEE